MSRRQLRQVPGGLKPGAQVIVRGRVPENSESFAINLQTGPQEGCDIALHFNPRMYSDSVVRNSYEGGDWKNEETDIPYFPFLRGASFSVRIYVTEDSYIIIVNNWNFVQFNHRLPIQDVRYVLLGEGAEYYESTIQNPSRVPYRKQFTHEFRAGTAVRVRGVVNDDADRFHLNLSNDPSDDTVALHFNPRQDSDVVVLNTNAGGWQEEQRDSESVPFRRGHFFDLFVMALEDKFNIYVNERFFTSYYHRIPMQDIRFISVEGDVTLMDVQSGDPLSDDFIEEVPSGLQKGDRVTVKGFFYPEGERFSINLLYGTSMDDDIGLHFNPRRDQNQVVLNNCEGGDWQEEECHELPQPFNDQLPFAVEIVAKGKKFKIYVNGRKLASFRARGSVQDIRGINVAGDAYFYDVQVLKPVERPFVCMVPATLLPGSWVQVVGTPKKEADNFAVNFQCGPSKDCEDDVAFHFNPRFNGEVCVRNTLEGGSWGEEERQQPDFPFYPKDRFEVNVLRLSDAFRVFVNGRFYIDYAHRMNPDNVCHLMLTGDCNFFEPEFF